MPFTLATGSNTPMEKVAAGAGARPWFQLYMWREKELSYELVRRAAKAGFETLSGRSTSAMAPIASTMRATVFPALQDQQRSVVDMLTPSRMARDRHGALCHDQSGMPEHVNYPGEIPGRSHRQGVGRQAPRCGPTRSSWEDVDRLRDIWPGKLVIKGIMRADDAQRAVDHGADAIVVSNHGGRNMDSAPATHRRAAGIVGAVGRRTTVIVDSGVRRGSDIVKCLALGAKAVLTGRATLYGIGAGGQAGAEKALAILKDEMRRTMAYVGLQRVVRHFSDDIWRG